MADHVGDDRPVAFPFESWHIIPHKQSCVIPEILAVVRKAHGGCAPESLYTEELMYAFCNAVGIIIADHDVESCLIFPNRTYASRKWANELYLAMMEAAYMGGWLDVETDAANAARTPTEPPATPEPNPPEPGTEDFEDDEVPEDKAALV